MGYSCTEVEQSAVEESKARRGRAKEGRPLTLVRDHSASNRGQDGKADVPRGHRCGKLDDDGLHIFFEGESASSPPRGCRHREKKSVQSSPKLPLKADSVYSASLSQLESPLSSPSGFLDSYSRS